MLLLRLRSPLELKGNIGAKHCCGWHYSICTNKEQIAGVSTPLHNAASRAGDVHLHPQSKCSPSAPHQACTVKQTLPLFWTACASTAQPNQHKKPFFWPALVPRLHPHLHRVCIPNHHTPTATLASQYRPNTQDAHLQPLSAGSCPTHDNASVDKQGMQTRSSHTSCSTHSSTILTTLAAHSNTGSAYQTSAPCHARTGMPTYHCPGPDQPALAKHIERTFATTVSCPARNKATVTHRVCRPARHTPATTHTA